MLATVESFEAVLRRSSYEEVEGLVLADDFKTFAKQAWQYVVPDPLVWGWHMDAICEHLQAVTDGEIENLLINVPFGCSKTVLTSILWPTWEWTRRPDGRWMFFSYDQLLSTEASTNSRRLVENPWFQARWPLKITTDQNQKTYFENESKGWRLASSVSGHGLGRHPDRIVVDDPQDPKMAASDVQRLSVLEWWKGTITSRGAWRGVRKVIIMQRLHEDDLSAHVLKGKGWEHLMLPMRMEASRRCSTRIGFVDRRDDGEVLDKTRFPPDKLADIEKELGPHNTASQLQQRPAPAGGGLIKRAWFRFWVPRGRIDDFPIVRDERGFVYPQQEIPDAMDQQLISLDCNKLREAENIRKKLDADPVSLGAWGRRGSDCYLLDRVNERLDLVETCDALKAMSARYPEAKAKVVEYAANGPAVMALLRREVAGLIPATPEGSKANRVLTSAKTDRHADARAISMQALFHSGNVWVPHPVIAPWVWSYIEELCGFPTAPHDDDVDMTSQALAHIQPSVWLDEYRKKKAEEEAAPVEIDPEAYEKQRMHDKIKSRLRQYEKEQRQRGREGAFGL